MQRRMQRAPRSRFFVWIGVSGILVALVGFTKTFFIPLFSGAFAAPLLIYVHGALLFGWVFFFAIQSILVHRRDVRLRGQSSLLLLAASRRFSHRDCCCFRYRSRAPRALGVLLCR